MDKKIMTAIAAVAVIAVVVAAACIVVFSDDDGDDDATVNTSAMMLVCGNANGDLTIDDKDMEIVKDVIAGDRTLEDCPLADVNGDGVVNDSDVELLQDIIDRKEGITIHVVTLDRSGNQTVVSVKYPLRNVVTYATNIQMPALYANGGQYVAGYFSASYSVAEKSISGAVNLDGSQRQITDSAWNNFTNLDSSLKSSNNGVGVGAILIDYSGIAQITSVRMDDLNSAKIPMLCYSSADALSEFRTVATLGFLFGGECETESAKYAEEAWNVYEEIQDKVGGYSDSEKTSYIACTMYIYICGPNSNFNSTASSAGGLPYSKVNSSFASTYTENSTKMTSTEALANYKDVGMIINNRSMDWGLDSSGFSAKVIESWDHDNSGKSSMLYYAGYDDKLVYVNNLLPGAVKMAYMAHALYPDQFSREWADNVLQTYIDMGTEPLSGQSLSSICSYIDYSTYKAAIGVTYTLTLGSTENGAYYTDASGTTAAASSYTIPADATIKTSLKNSVYSLTISKTSDSTSPVTIYGIGSGYAVSKWTISNVSTNLPTGDVTVTATFAQAHTVSFVSADSNGTVSTESVSGIPEGAAFSVSGNSLTIYGNTVKGTGADGYMLLNWTVDGKTVSSKTTVSADTEVTANFATTCKITVSAGEHGEVTSGKSAASGTTTFTIIVPTGLKISTTDISSTSTTNSITIYGSSVKATADDGYVVSSWTIGDDQYSTESTITVTGDITMTANFAVLD